MRNVVASVIITVLLAACAGDGAEESTGSGTTTSPDGEASVEEWLVILDAELSGMSGSTAWSDDTAVRVAASCGPVDEVEGWTLLAEVPAGPAAVEFEPPTGSWDVMERGGRYEGTDDLPTAWRHRSHPELSVHVSSGHVVVRVELPAAAERWGAVEHPRVEDVFHCG